MTASALELAGMLLACGGAAVALLARDPRIRYGAGAIALVAAPALVAGDVWQTERFVDLRGDPAKLVAVIAFAVVAVGCGAVLFHRVRWAFPVSAFVALPLRVPVQLGGATSHLLLPLYLVIAAGFVCFAYRALAPDGSAGKDGANPTNADAAAEAPAVTWLYRALAATLVVYAIQTAYSATSRTRSRTPPSSWSPSPSCSSS